MTGQHWLNVVSTLMLGFLVLGGLFHVSTHKWNVDVNDRLVALELVTGFVEAECSAVIWGGTK